jgi:hypothetical protein
MFLSEKEVEIPGLYIKAMHETFFIEVDVRQGYQSHICI